MTARPGKRGGHPEIPRLLDGNVLLALTETNHMHHEAAANWFKRFNGPFATCPITQGSLIRLRVMLGASPSIQDAMNILEALTHHPMHRFWANDIAYTTLSMRGVQGHRQVTDAYLAALARHHGGRMATFDRGLAALHADVAELIT
jgi:hypothetical protein